MTHHSRGAAKLRHWKLRNRKAAAWSPVDAIPTILNAKAAVNRQSVTNEMTCQKPNARQDTKVKILKICGYTVECSDASTYNLANAPYADLRSVSCEDQCGVIIERMEEHVCLPSRENANASTYMMISHLSRSLWSLSSLSRGSLTVRAV